VIRPKKDANNIRHSALSQEALVVGQSVRCIWK
jgi:hypothetical protein